MKVLIVSDTHGREQNLAEALEQTGPIDQLIHLGDVEGGAEHIRELAGDAPAAIIAGNNDFFCDLPNERIFTIGGHRIFMTHGHGYFVHSGTLYLKREARKKGAENARLEKELTDLRNAPKQVETIIQNTHSKSLESVVTFRQGKTTISTDQIP